MTVNELIELLKTYPQDLLVAYEIHSEQCLLDAKDIKIKELCEPRSDGWVHDYRPDRPSIKYLVLPGN